MKSFRPFELAKSGLSPEVVESIRGCIAKYPEIEKVILYGSRAKGNFRNGSDIDLCLVGDDLSAEAILNLDGTLDELMLPYSFDLSIYEHIDNPDFKDHIDRVGMVLYP